MPYRCYVQNNKVRATIVLCMLYTLVYQAFDYSSITSSLKQKDGTTDFIVGDGNCMFRSLSKELFGAHCHHLELRKISDFEGHNDLNPTRQRFDNAGIFWRQFHSGTIVISSEM